MEERVLQALAILKENQADWFKRTKILEYNREGEWWELCEDQPIRLLWEYEIRIVER